MPHCQLTSQPSQPQQQLLLHHAPAWLGLPAPGRSEPAGYCSRWLRGDLRRQQGAWRATRSCRGTVGCCCCPALAPHRAGRLGCSTGQARDQSAQNGCSRLVRFRHVFWAVTRTSLPETLAGRNPKSATQTAGEAGKAPHALGALDDGRNSHALKTAGRAVNCSHTYLIRQIHAFLALYAARQVGRLPTNPLLASLSHSSNATRAFQPARW